MWKEIKQEERQQQVQKNPTKQHKYTQKQYYRCYCQKIYTTYPALYLHIKNKHQAKVSMQMKKKLKPKVQWSGNIKKVVYEFLEFGDSQDSSQNIIQDLRSRPSIKIQHSNYLKKEQDIQGSVGQYHTQKKKRSTIMTMQQDNIKSIFKKYKKESQVVENEEIKYFRSQMLEWFQSFLNQNYKQIEPNVRYYNFCLQSNAQKIPFAFSSFFLYMSHKELSVQLLKKQLSLLGKWLYENKHSQYLVIKQEEYEKIRHIIQ